MKVEPSSALSVRKARLALGKRSRARLASPVLSLTKIIQLAFHAKKAGSIMLIRESAASAQHLLTQRDMTRMFQYIAMLIQVRKLPQQLPRHVSSMANCMSDKPARSTKDRTSLRVISAVKTIS